MSVLLCGGHEQRVDGTQLVVLEVGVGCSLLQQLADGEDELTYVATVDADHHRHHLVLRELGECLL